MQIPSGGEREAIIEGFSQTLRAYPEPVSVASLFEAVASRCGDEIAVSDGGRRLGYRDLNERANQLASHLRALGVRAETIVAVSLDRSVHFAVAVLAVLKAGGAWLPLDPNQPRERLTAMLDDARPAILLTEDRLVGGLPETGLPIVRIDSDWPAVSRGSSANADVCARPQDAAYVMYTSGSTGSPKGVILTHRGLWNYVQAMGDALAIRGSDVYLHTASFGFSSSVRQLLVPLTHGAHCAIASLEQLVDPVLLLQEVQRLRATILDLVPSYWRAALDALGRLDPEPRAALRENSLRLTLSASEPLTFELVRRLMAEFGQARMVNMYGQTETTGIVTVYAVPTRPDGEGVVSLGRPIVNTRISVLDPNRKPVPVGTVGEIWVSGPSLAMGYLNRESETSAAFQPDSFAGEPGSRMYHTGDLGSLGEDGTLAFRGRRDDQVKIQGVRIELGEVERALARHPSVRECGVLVHEDGAGQKQLVACVVRHSGSGTKDLELRAHLSAILPHSMFPARFVFLESLPRAPGGKLDRSALRALVPDRASRPGRDHVENGADPGRALPPLPMRTAPEWHQTLVEWNQTEAEYPKDKTVAQLFEEWAMRTPEATAVEFEGSRLTYGQLNERANRLARHLRTRGVGPEVLVSVCLERSLELVVAVLAVLKAGGGCLPLDSTHPLQRLRSIRDEAGARLVLTKKGTLNEVAECADRLDLDSDWAQVARESGENFTCPAAPGNLAYVIYTSGSTGRPKGVEIEHGSLTNHVWATVKQFGIRPSDRLLQFSALTFDASVQEIFATLGAGATLVLRSEEMIAPVATFLARCQESRVTILSLPTAFWHEVVATASEEGLSLPAPLRLMAVGGERALPERFAQWLALAGASVRFVNGYGPTEATITATRWEPEPAPQSPVPPILPIGRPIANTCVYVLDASGQPVPVGIVGELYIGGVCVARGYRNRPDLTAERFVPDPFGGGRQKLYRTGDRVRWRSDGLLEFLGRDDGQIKVRGFRVEIGEVEAALRRVAGVRGAVVRAREDVPGEMRLIAYVVPDRARSPSTGDLRRSLKETLPAYMVPSQFILLEDLPLNTHGKLDLSALPAPEFARPEVDDVYRGPRTPVEAGLSEIWAKVLRVDMVGVDDDFFELGGHSLLAAKVISRMRDAFHVELPLRDFYMNPTVAGLALAVVRTQAERVAPDEMERLLAELEPPRNERIRDGR